MTVIGASDRAGGGIPFPAKREGLPCEDELLNAASPRSPKISIDQEDSSVNRHETADNPILSFLDKLGDLKDRYQVDESCVIGVDVGLSSCGIAQIIGDKINYLGVRLFEPGENQRTLQTKAADRRNKRAQRGRIRRHSRRRLALQRLLASAGMWPDSRARASLNPYYLRLQSLDELLSPCEFGVALFHAVKRRGFVARGGALGETGSGSSCPPQHEAGPMAAAAGRNESRLSAYRTAGEMLACDPAFELRKRNRFGNYQAALPRKLIEQEVAAMFAAQRRLGSLHAAEELQTAFEAIAFFQLPRRYTAATRRCPYLPHERIGVKRSPTIERFAFFDRLTKVRLDNAGDIRRLEGHELLHAANRFGRTAEVTYLDLRRWLVLDPDVRFIGVRREDMDIVSPRGSAFGTVTLRSVLGRSRWAEIERQDGMSDALAEAVTLAGTAADLRDRLCRLALPDDVMAPVLAAFADGELDGFAGMARLSAAAAGRMLPHLEKGHLVFDAAIKAGFDPLSLNDRILHSMHTPRMIRPILEAMRQVYALIEETGALPGRIHVEVARELALTPVQRQMAHGIYRKTSEARKAARGTIAEILPAAAINSRMIERYMLWQEQGGKCVYTV